jgi:hypothetical protein
MREMTAEEAAELAKLESRSATRSAFNGWRQMTGKKTVENKFAKQLNEQHNQKPSKIINEQTENTDASDMASLKRSWQKTNTTIKSFTGPENMIIKKMLALYDNDGENKIKAEIILFERLGIDNYKLTYRIIQ